MTSGPGEQTILIHTLPNISPVKVNRRRNLFNYQNITREIFFVKNYAENETD